jgi:hypothetical protein
MTYAMRGLRMTIGAVGGASNRAGAAEASDIAVRRRLTAKCEVTKN